MTGEAIIAYCGLVCSECGQFKRHKCEGCHSEKPMFKGCKVKKCAMDRNITTCAGCVEFRDLKQCPKLNNFISKVFKLIFRTDRLGNLELIRSCGLEKFKSQNS